MGAEADTKYYDDERSEESQKYSKKETDIEKTTTFTWDDWDLKRSTASGETTWAQLRAISATVIKRPDGTCVVNFSTRISSFIHRTDNDPSREDNSPLILRFKNKDGALLFFVNVETEPYASQIYHGLTVRCHYWEEDKDSSYEVGVVPFDELDRAQLSKPGGRPIFVCN
jgi:hypothetical protein